MVQSRDVRKGELIMKQCISCGREIEDTTNICPYCGMQQKKDPKTVAVIVIAGVIAILLLLLFLVLSLKSLFTKQIENTIAEGQSYMKNTTSASNVVANEVTNQVSNETSNEAINQVVNETTNEIESSNNSSILRQPSYDSYSSIFNSVSNDLRSQNEQYQKTKFENYFGTEVSALEVKTLLSEIRTNNLTNSRSGDLATIGVCYFTKNDIQNPPVGCYTYRIDNIRSADFDNCYFTPDVQAITNILQARTTYSVNAPNTKACKLDLDGMTGFEYEGNYDGQAVLGSSGGYYSSGSVRLIYIYEN